MRNQQTTQASLPLAGLMKLDNLGRVVIPKPICDTYDLHPTQPLNITMCEDGIVLQKHIKGVSRHKNRIGLVRLLDPLDRITLPKEVRNEFDLDSPQKVHVVFDNNEIIIKKLAA